MNKKSFALAIKMLTSNFSLREPDPKNKEEMEAWKKRLRLIFGILEAKDFTDQDLKKAVMGIISNESSLFGNLPPIAMFLKYAGKQEKDPKEQAEIEAESIIETCSYPTPVLFDNELTNATLHSYGGIGTVYFDVYDSFNRNQKSRNWVKKELASIWLSCYETGNKSNKPSLPSGSGRNAEVSFIGDKVKCQELWDNSILLLEEKSNVQKVNIPHMDNVIAELGEALKINRKGGMI